MDGDIPGYLRGYYRGAYTGPDGSRAFVAVMLVAEGPSAARNAWEVANEFFGEARYTFEATWNREDELED